jgi:hypothetical protein
MSQLTIRDRCPLVNVAVGSQQWRDPIIRAVGTLIHPGLCLCVQALIADDRALIERLIRFAQAHDLLKKNAERAQKLAQESNGALETYSKQVKTLEDRNMSMTDKIAMM